MRDHLARLTASGLIAGVVLLAAFFAHRENRAASPPVEATADVTPAADLDAMLVEEGREIYEVLSCARCHALEGVGNPRSALDAIGSRRSREEIRAWVTGAEPARGALPRSAARAKESLAAQLSRPDLDALVEYLASRR